MIDNCDKYIYQCDAILNETYLDLNRVLFKII